MIVYADFTCPRCAVAAERLREAQVRTCFRHLALKARHPRARAARARRRGRRAAGRVLGSCTTRSTPTRAGSTTRTSGRTPSASASTSSGFEADRRDPQVAERVEADVRSALRAGAATTPTLVIGGALHQGAPEPELLAEPR